MNEINTYSSEIMSLYNDYSINKVNNQKKMNAEERNKIVKEYYEKKRREAEEEMKTWKEIAKKKGLDSSILSLEV